MQHRRELNAKFTRRMNRDAKLERLANAGRFNALTNAAPKCCIQQDHIARRIKHVRSELFEIDDDRVRRQRHSHLFACSPHSVEAEDRIFEIIVVNVFDLLAKPDRLFG